MRQPAALLALCLAIVGGPCARSAPPPGLIALQAWIRATPGSDVAAAYLTLHNTGTGARVVTGVRSPLAGRAMIHESTVVNGLATMRARERLRIGAGETLRLAPGGLHVMLMGLKRPLKVGEEVPLVLELEGGDALAVNARVRAPGEG